MSAGDVFTLRTLDTFVLLKSTSINNDFEDLKRYIAEAAVTTIDPPAPLVVENDVSDCDIAPWTTCNILFKNSIAARAVTLGSQKRGIRYCRIT